MVITTPVGYKYVPTLFEEQLLLTPKSWIGMNTNMSEGEKSTKLQTTVMLVDLCLASPRVSSLERVAIDMMDHGRSWMLFVQLRKNLR